MGSLNKRYPLPNTPLLFKLPTPQKFAMEHKFLFIINSLKKVSYFTQNSMPGNMALQITLKKEKP
jgi:hypothetical protein